MVEKRRHDVSDSDDADLFRPSKKKVKRDNSTEGSPDSDSSGFRQEERHAKYSFEKNSSSDSSDIDSDHEVYILTCPEQLPEEMLVNANISPTSKTEITCENVKYSVRLDMFEESKIVSIAKPNSDPLINVPIHGKISVVREMRTKKAKIDIGEDYAVPYPSNLKVRHPLLGVDYKRYMKKAVQNFKKSPKISKKERKSKVRDK